MIIYFYNYLWRMKMHAVKVSSAAQCILTMFISWCCHTILTEQYNVALNQVSVSGISSGAAMATQFHVAYSQFVRGVGLFAGGKCCKSESICQKSYGLSFVLVFLFFSFWVCLFFFSFYFFFLSLHSNQYNTYMNLMYFTLLQYQTAWE